MPERGHCPGRGPATGNEVGPPGGRELSEQLLLGLV